MFKYTIHTILAYERIHTINQNKAKKQENKIKGIKKYINTVDVPMCLLNKKLIMVRVSIFALELDLRLTDIIKTIQTMIRKWSILKMNK